MRILVFDQSSPLHPVSESRGGTLSVTHGRRTDGRKSSGLILDIVMRLEVIQLDWLKKNNVEAEDIDKSAKQTMNSPTGLW